MNSLFHPKLITKLIGLAFLPCAVLPLGEAKANELQFAIGTVQKNSSNGTSHKDAKNEENAACINEFF